jgi:hypothetical protein
VVEHFDTLALTVVGVHVGLVVRAPRVSDGALLRLAVVGALVPRDLWLRRGDAASEFVVPEAVSLFVLCNDLLK